MNIKKISKQIEQYYSSHHQHLIIDTWEMRENTDNDCVFDVYLADSDIFLFTIQNYNGFRDIVCINKSYFRPTVYQIKETWDGAKASSTPLYIDGVITLPTFKRITEQDILCAVNYFVHEVLHMWGIFNISIKPEEKIGE